MLITDDKTRMVIRNVGKQGFYKEIDKPGNKKEGFHFDVGANVSVPVELGEYLLKKYNNPKMWIHIKKIGPLGVATNSNKVEVDETKTKTKVRGKKSKDK